jgi:nucleolar protein 4
MREASAKQRQNIMKSNPTLHISLTRLSVRNIPRHINSKGLKALAREAVVGFAKDVKTGLRQPLSKEELSRSAEMMKEAERLRKLRGKGVVKQAKVVFEGREGSKISEKSGAGRSRGYGFIEYTSHRCALMGLRWLNGHVVSAPSTEIGVGEKKKRLIVEFAIENAQVVNRRRERELKSRNPHSGVNEKEQLRGTAGGASGSSASASGQGVKRRRQDGTGDRRSATSAIPALDTTDECKKKKKDNQLAKRNRIISKKRMMRRAKKGN